MCGLISGVWRFGEEILGGWRVAGAFFVEGLPLLEKWLKACQEGKIAFMYHFFSCYDDWFA